MKSPEDKYSVGDIIRAKVFQVKPSIQLTTKGKDYGTIRSLCQRCRSQLEKKDNILECHQCGHKEKRKMAFDYGQYDLSKL